MPPAALHVLVPALRHPVRGAARSAMDFQLLTDSSTLEMGNLTSTTQVPITVWSTRGHTLVLESIQLSETDSQISVQGPAIGAPLHPESTAQWVLRVPTDGPAQIDCTVTWRWRGGAQVVVHITGARAVAFMWQPEFPIRERIEYATEVLQRADGSEQRIGLRIEPRHAISFSTWVTGIERQQLESALQGWGARPWVLPLWQHCKALASDLHAGALDLELAHDAVAPTPGLALIARADQPLVHEIIRIVETRAHTARLSRASARGWRTGDLLIPARSARLQAEVRIPRFTGDTTERIQMNFECVEPEVTRETTIPELPKWEGIPVFPVHVLPTDWSTAPSLTLTRTLGELDNISGSPLVLDRTRLPMVRITRNLTLTAAQIPMLLALLSYLRGRWADIWIHDEAHDLSLQSDIQPGAQRLSVHDCHASRFLGDLPHRRAVCLQLQNGMLLMRTVTHILRTDIGEQLLLSQAIDSTIERAHVHSIHWMSRARLASDGIELDWIAPNLLQVALSFTIPRSRP